MTFLMLATRFFCFKLRVDENIPTWLVTDFNRFFPYIISELLSLNIRNSNNESNFVLRIFTTFLTNNIVGLFLVKTI